VTTRLFHTIVVCGAVLGTVPLACGVEPGAGSPAAEDESQPDAGAADAEVANRCKLADGGCAEHCNPLADGGCLDPCFVHTKTCSPDCLQLDGSCGWPPTK